MATKAKAKPKTKRNPRHVPSDATRVIVQALAADGFSKEAIARELRVSIADLERLYGQDLLEGPDRVAAKLSLMALQGALSGRDPVGARVLANGFARARNKRAQSEAQQQDAREPALRPGNVVDPEGRLVAHSTGLWRLNLGDPRWREETEERCRAAGKEGPISYDARLDREFEQWKAERTGPDGVIRLRPGDPGKPLERLAN